ncbi:MAG: 1-(5-phosphoribosyl)-5-[(5-phosphoribosylamino)methylideneamino]imidazole-4-carboxamide isomerase [Burkholderia sp.]|nr:1-(5-phosphoribosyl)-5-[(5-phosphoribosylamino)methylideneamino]imidazole-4-carboxamide isomerase [Burkholderia sp.]
MLIIPAIDLKDQRCVRLKQGDMEKETIYSDNPLFIARKWCDLGARRLHLVDLNGAFVGKPKNDKLIEKILNEIHGEIPVQLGGGIRSLKTIERYLDAGVSYIIIGTAAVKDPVFIQEACRIFAGNIIISLDAKDGRVATDGWNNITQYKPSDLALKFKDYGVESIIYTDISRDGMLQGINIDATAKLAREVGIPVIASGGLSNLNDIKNLCEVEDSGIHGVICGRAIYSGDLDFSSIQKHIDKLRKKQSCI